MFALTRKDTAVLKGIAICAMLCHHLYAFPPATVEGYSGITLWIGMLGKVCVALFLFCSGYGLASQYKPVSIKEDIKFVVRRLVKFYANYWIIFVFFVPITVFVFHRTLVDAYGEHVNILKRLLFDIIGIQGYRSYNPTWWFNKVILILYLLFPFLFRAIHFKPWLILLVSLVVMRVSVYVPNCINTVDVLTWQCPFIMGALWKMYEDKFPTVEEWMRNHPYIFGGISILLLIVFVILRMYPIIPYWSGIQIDGFFACAMTLCLIAILRRTKYLMNTLAFLGKHSMNIYMTHTFVNAFWYAQLLHAREWMRGGGNFVVLMIICLTISMLIEFLKNKIRFYEFVHNIIKRI